MKASKGYFLDIDGVVRRGSRPIAEGVVFVRALQDAGIPFLFLTNNSTRTREENRDMLGSIGIDVGSSKILSSSMVTAHHILSGGKGGSAYVVGEHGLVRTLEDAGIDTKSEDPDYVVVGWDRSYTFEKMRVASSFVRQGAYFVATNTDATFPADGDILPGAGAIVASIQVASGTCPEVMGKPGSEMFSYALEKIGLAARDVAMVGDRMDTDIVGARRAGLRAVLVTTGISSREEALRSSLAPDIIVSSLGELFGGRGD